MLNLTDHRDLNFFGSGNTFGSYFVLNKCHSVYLCFVNCKHVRADFFQAIEICRLKKMKRIITL